MTEILEQPSKGNSEDKKTWPASRMRLISLWRGSWKASSPWESWGPSPINGLKDQDKDHKLDLAIDRKLQFSASSNRVMCSHHPVLVEDGCCILYHLEIICVIHFYPQPQYFAVVRFGSNTHTDHSGQDYTKHFGWQKSLLPTDNTWVSRSSNNPGGLLWWW